MPDKEGKRNARKKNIKISGKKKVREMPEKKDGKTNARNKNAREMPVEKS